MKKIPKKILNLILITVLVPVFISGIVFMAGCKDGDIKIEEPATPEDSTDKEEAEEEESEDSTIDQDEDDVKTAEGPAEEEEAIQEQTSQEDTADVEEAEEVPVEITEEIETADNYFNEGKYAEAAKEYRDASRAINDSELSQELKDELTETIGQNLEDAENITETARMHHTNAMTLQYEKRFEEAKSELEAALSIYPRYQTAIDALDSLEALMGLK